MLNFSIYKDSFGKPKEGIHSIRYMNIAIVDVTLTILFAIFIHHILFPNTQFLIILILLFILGIITHRIFCVRTTVDKLIFG